MPHWQINSQTMEHIYFIGIGGIGMSALALYYRFKGKEVRGYDRTPSDITEMLTEKDIAITFSEDLDFIPKNYTPENTLVVYTPAIPKEHKQLVYFQTHGYKVCKRSEVLGLITEDSFCLAVAGTHGKTTTSSILAHILVECKAPVSAFLGGICENFQSNFICKGTELTVVEADEFDRSFLRLSPSIACITAVDADHLDIYGTAEEFQKGFEDFTHRLKPGGKLIVRKGLPFAGLTYGIADGSDYEISEVKVENGGYHFCLSYTDSKTGLREVVKDCTLFRPGEHHLLNALAAVAVAHQAGYPLAYLAHALASFKGVKRRFSYVINTPEQVFIDDYAHHPTEIKATLAAAKNLRDKKLWVAFQPHTYSRTKSLFKEFSEAFYSADKVILTDIYAAREKDPGDISSKDLAQSLYQKNVDAIYLPTFDDIVNYVKDKLGPNDIFITCGAGPINRVAEALLDLKDK